MKECFVGGREFDHFSNPCIIKDILTFPQTVLKESYLFPNLLILFFITDNETTENKHTISLIKVSPKLPNLLLIRKSVKNFSI